MKKPEQVAEVESRALAVLDDAKQIVVSTDEEQGAALAFVRGLRDVKKQIDETFDPIVKAAHAAHREALAQKKKHAEPVLEAERIVKALVGDYEAEKRRKAAEVERARREEEARLAKAAEEERQRRAAQATAPIPSPEPPPPPVPAAPPPPFETPAVPTKTEGVTLRTKHVAQVEDLVALCAAIASGAAPADLVQPNATALRKFATATKGAVAVPGVRFSTTTETAIR